jgi:hypothetical protein
MAGSLAANIAIPIIAFLGVFGWVSAVLYAGFHPEWKHKSQPPRADVAGGAFLASSGGRQLEPIWGEPPRAIPPPRVAAPQESYETADVASAHSATSQEPAPRAEESQRTGSQ